MKLNTIIIEQYDKAKGQKHQKIAKTVNHLLKNKSLIDEEVLTFIVKQAIANNESIKRTSFDSIIIPKINAVLSHKGQEKYFNTLKLAVAREGNLEVAFVGKPITMCTIDDLKFAIEKCNQRAETYIRRVKYYNEVLKLCSDPTKLVGEQLDTTALANAHLAAEK